MTDDQSLLIGSYSDNCTTQTLLSFINNKDELDRLNNWRETEWSQHTLNEVLGAAILVRRFNWDSNTWFDQTT